MTRCRLLEEIDVVRNNDAENLVSVDALRIARHPDGSLSILCWGARPMTLTLTPANARVLLEQLGEALAINAAAELDEYLRDHEEQDDAAKVALEAIFSRLDALETSDTKHHAVYGSEVHPSYPVASNQEIWSKAEPPSVPVSCERCGGAGLVSVVHSGGFTRQEACRACAGLGRVEAVPREWARREQAREHAQIQHGAVVATGIEDGRGAVRP